MKSWSLYSILIVLFGLLSVTAKAQTDYDWIKLEVDAVLNPSQYKKIQSAEKMLRKAKKTRMKSLKVNSRVIRWRDKAETATGEKKRSEAMAKLSKYENQYAAMMATEVDLKVKANKKISDTYKALLGTVRPRDNKQVLEAGRKLEAQSNKVFNDVLKKQRETKKEKVHKLRYAVFENMQIDMQKAVWYQLHAYAIYTTMLTYEPTDSFYVNYEFNNSTLGTPENGTDSSFVSTDSTITDTIEPIDSTKIATDAEPLVYKVQLIAVTKQLSKKELSRLYSGKNKVEIMEHAGLYKYFAGAFDNQADAEAFMTSLGIKDSFVVAFRGDERVSEEE
ncbi:MAG TPA: hypothetical protein DCQ31_09850 [Bacteroidales bacterium]|nr:hypothetical protein [Bacteroidales bacterium]